MSFSTPRKEPAPSPELADAAVRAGAATERLQKSWRNFVDFHKRMMERKARVSGFRH